MKKTAAALSVALAVLAATPALARSHHAQQKSDPPGYGLVEQGTPFPQYRNEVPFAPF